MTKQPHRRPSRRRAPRAAAASPSAAHAELERVLRIADFRAALRTFLRRSEQVSRSCGLTPRRYLLLLMIKGAPDRSERLSFSDLAERLKLDRVTVTELVARAERAGLVARQRSASDRRVTYLRLTDEGERRLALAIAASDEDRRQLAGAFRQLARTFKASTIP
ncbi:MAG: MarR family transcriptional regulator [Thermoleophilia bacterium]|nr:MarR family transcriptional regulator [Thermoleophilia bacterium]